MLKQNNMDILDQNSISGVMDKTRDKTPFERPTDDGGSNHLTSRGTTVGLMQG